MNMTRARSRLVGLALIFVPSYPALAFQDPAPAPRLPSVLGPFRFADSARSGDPPATRLSYVDSAGTRVDVFVYPIPLRRPSESVAAVLEREAAAFVLSLAEQAGGDRYEGYRVVVDTLRRVQTETSSIPMRILVFVYGRSEDAFVSFMHVFVVANQYVKVRLTLPFEVWQTSLAPNFALDLARYLHR